MKTLLRIAVIAALLVFSPSHAGELLRIYTNSYEPYYGENMPEFGPVIQITRLAFKEAGYDVQVRFLPWARVIEDGRKGLCDVIVGVWFNKGREDWMALTDAILENEIGFYKRKDDPLIFTNYADLKTMNAVIGTVRGYISPEGFDPDGLKIEEVREDSLNIKKLLHHRIRLAMVDKRLGVFLAQKMNGEKEIEWLVTLQRLPLRNAIIKTAGGGWEKRLVDFNRGLSALKRNGVAEQILKEHSAQIPHGNLLDKYSK